MELSKLELLPCGGKEDDLETRGDAVFTVDDFDEVSESRRRLGSVFVF